MEQICGFAIVCDHKTAEIVLIEIEALVDASGDLRITVAEGDDFLIVIQ